MAERFPHPRGLLYFDLYWHLGDPEETLHLVEGTIEGEGPWKVGGCVITVLGCQGSDGELALAWEAWLEARAEGYPPEPLVRAIARRLGARA